MIRRVVYRVMVSQQKILRILVLCNVYITHRGAAYNRLGSVCLLTCLVDFAQRSSNNYCLLKLYSQYDSALNTTIKHHTIDCAINFSNTLEKVPGVKPH